VAVTVAFVAVAILVLTQGTFPTGIGASGSQSTTTTTTKPHSPTTTVLKSQVKVQVANASSTAGAATKVTQQLQTLGWNTLPPVNASSQVPSTMIYFAQGRRAAAVEVAAELKVSKKAIAPLTPSVPVAGAAGDDIVVLVGPDIAG
jgi:LytR cell envelope-related transcriptional attenuator